MKKIRHQSPRRKPILQITWNNQALDHQVSLLPETVSLYWGQSDELSEDQIARIVDDEDGQFEVWDELLLYNLEEFDRMRDEAIADRLYAMRKLGNVTADTERRFRQRAEVSDERMLPDPNLKDLARNNRGEYFTVTVPMEISFQAWRGVESAGQVEELCKVCTVLNVNPKHLQGLVSADNDNRPSYDPAPVIFPDIPERDGNEYVTPESLVGELNECMYGGELVFMVAIDMVDILDNREDYVNGPLKIRKGTLGLLYEYCNGAGSTAEMELVKDLILPAGSYTLTHDKSLRYGLQSCYGFTPEPWRRGVAEPGPSAE